MSQSTESTTESNPFTKPGFIIAAALVVALIAAAIVIFLLPKGQDNAQPAPASSPDSASAAPTKSADAAGKSICGLPSSTETALGTAPKSKWELVGKMAVPTDSKTSGPGLTDADGFRSCFAHSPTGALYSAMNVGALGSAGSPQLEVKLADKLLVPGMGRDAAMKEAASSSASSGSDTTIQVKGFSIKSYTASEANVDLAFETNKGVLVHTILSMRWMDGDWKVKPADDGVTFSGVSQLSDLSGFILWSGV
ncbi:hypothetical protein QK290_14360 [Pseudarthrobacter sp. AL07]|uniref:hypothetical protein n=1 Tax=unclassified Pseudarthrobacter TaxID=2647000 RepID=UPI002499B916|nr:MULTISPECIES: hypothetical protein [unclassified Pseudarthrobacter]MDI3195504.1 hypothetical protein [Pseudarthrobacter sp. AL20]MDI3209657.1 hypothetical protein [Pseudarthrobacter sp. AL07]